MALAKMNVQLLGHGSVILMSASLGTEMNANFVISDEEFVRMVQELMEKAQSYPDSDLHRLTAIMSLMDEKMETDPVTA